MTDFLFELRCEEIPARMQEKAREDLARLFQDRLRALNVEWQSIESYATPRRLALIVRGLAETTSAMTEERKGPRADAPDAAIAGFLRSTGLTREQLVTRDDGKGGQILFAVIERPGIPTPSVLANACIHVVHAFPWPKSMRWGDASHSTESLRWVRPLQGIIALFGDRVVPFEVAGIQSGATTVGHRFHHPGVITIGSAADYADKLRACHVILDGAERRAIIAVGAKMAAQKAGLSLIEDDGLLYENAGLTEWPVPLLGRFDADFLSVPPEVIQLTARVNQKYFVCADGAGKLANAFICVANIDAVDGGAMIVEGNRKVLAARLSDARFFYETDLKTPLEDQAAKLEKIVFHEKLGTLADKVDRVAKLARWLVEQGIVKGADPAHAERAARLAKADLVTGMVGEFPELQGVMGGYYAAAQGEPAEVAEAIRDHYKPVGQGDAVPTAPVTVAVSLADKLDTLFGFFGAGLLPTGSKDPFALRRYAIGYIRLVEANAIRVLVSEVARAWGGSGSVGTGLQVEDFLHDRLGVMMRDEGVRYDVVQASTGLDTRFDGDLYRVRRRALALQSFIANDDGTNLLAGYKRAANILKKEGVTTAEWTPLAYTPEPAEAALIAALDAAGPKAATAVEAEDFEGAMAALATLRAPIDAFFDSVTVNDSDPQKRTARLALLARMRDAVHRVADFSKIEG
jgi:glycyl-tRNA synthetase beta chain